MFLFFPDLHPFLVPGEVGLSLVLIVFLDGFAIIFDTLTDWLEFIVDDIEPRQLLPV
jgi:hypothetical protein